MCISSPDCKVDLNFGPWAAQYDTQLLIELTPKCVVFATYVSVLYSEVCSLGTMQGSGRLCPHSSFELVTESELR